jgi:hypothetical protein
MESQLGSFGLGPGDNKGILSLLTAIEQSEDNFDQGNRFTAVLDSFWQFFGSWT